MKTLRPLIVLSSLLLAMAAHAQTSLRLGPSVVGMQSTVALGNDHAHNSMSRLGFEAGLLASLHCGHLALQPALRYAQRNFGRQVSYPDGISEVFRLGYLTLPVQLAYTQHTDGRGFQVFAGPYLSWLVGGRYTASGGFTGRQVESEVVGADEHTVDLAAQQPDGNFYAHHVDLGVQAGVGYQRGRALLQASYSLGLRNVATPTAYTSGGIPTGRYGPTYYNRAVQVSLSYLFGAKD